MRAGSSSLYAEGSQRGPQTDQLAAPVENGPAQRRLVRAGPRGHLATDDHRSDGVTEEPGVRALHGAARETPAPCGSAQPHSEDEEGGTITSHGIAMPSGTSLTFVTTRIATTNAPTPKTA